MNLNALFAAILGLIVGLGLAYHSWDSKIFFYFQEDARQPAAIKNVFDFSDLQGAALQNASKNRLLQDAKIEAGADDLDLHLGHFVMKNEAGYKTFACREFDRIELTFVAEGMATDGERPTMKVDALCTPNSDGSQIQPINVPVSKVLAEKPGNIELQYWDTLKTNLHFAGMSGEWPSQWVLTQVRLFNSGNNDHQLVVAKEDIRTILTQPLEMDWSKFSVKR